MDAYWAGFLSGAVVFAFVITVVISLLAISDQKDRERREELQRLRWLDPDFDEDDDLTDTITRG